MVWLASAKATYPVLRSAPTISGVDEVGRYARLNYGDWVHYKTALLPRNYPSQQWQRGDTSSGPWADITGAIYPIYRRTPSDLNKYLRCKESRIAETGTFYTFTDAVGPTLAESRTSYDLTTTKGFKTLTAVGSINVASPNTLNLVSNPGFLVGDSFIVECGGEAGAGARGTVGVGGQWPPLTYATTTAMNADTSKANGTQAGVIASGDVYYWSSSSNAWVAYDPANDYYDQKIQPLSLVATITGVSGTTITFNGPGAKVSTTSANVYFDNSPKMNALVRANDSNKIFTVPAGTYYFGSLAQPSGLYNTDFVGAGNTSTIFRDASRGAPLHISSEQSQDNVFRDIGFLGNVTDTTYGRYDPADGNGNRAFNAACMFHLGSGGIVENCAFTNCWEAWSASSGSPNQWAVNSSITMTRQRVYIQWQSEQADSDYCGTINCSLTSDYLTSGFEFFRSKGCRSYSPVLVNATMSVNTAGDWDIFTPSITIHANAQFDNVSFNRQKPCIDINSNIGNTSGSGLVLTNLGGAVWYPTVIQEGYINASNDSLTGCIISPACSNADGSGNVLIMGGYPLHPEQGGLFQAPDYSATSTANGPRAVASDGDAFVIGIRVKGAPRTPVGSQFSNINFNALLGTVTNCVADQIMAATKSGNQTNATYGP